DVSPQSRSPCRRLAAPHPPPPPLLYTLSLHDALPILPSQAHSDLGGDGCDGAPGRSGDRSPRGSARAQSESPQHGIRRERRGDRDRKSTRLNSSHVKISYAVFCLKKNKTHARIGSPPG